MPILHVNIETGAVLSVTANDELEAKIRAMSPEDQQAELDRMNLEPDGVTPTPGRKLVLAEGKVQPRQTLKEDGTLGPVVPAEISPERQAIMDEYADLKVVMKDQSASLKDVCRYLTLRDHL